MQFNHASSPTYHTQKPFTKILYMLLADPSVSLLGRLIMLLVMLAVVATTFVVIYLSFFQYDYTLLQIDRTIFAIFGLELIARVLTSTAYGQTIWQMLYEVYFWVDLISVIPLALQELSIHHGLLTCIRTICLFKITRYLTGMKILIRAVESSLKQFWLISVAFLITILFFAIGIYYCEISMGFHEDDTTNITSVYDSIWLVITTLTTVGYGDKSPKSELGRIFAVILAYMGNSIILALPIAIIGLDFQRAYTDDMEQKMQQRIKLNYLNTDLDIQQSQLKYMYSRLNEIEQRNKELSKLLEQSNEMARDLTQSMETLFLRMGEEYGMQDLAVQVREKKLRDKRRNGVYNTRVVAFEKLMKAKQKIKITNLFKTKSKVKGNAQSVRNKEGTIIKSQQQQDSSARSVSLFRSKTKHLMIQNRIIQILLKLRDHKSRRQKSKFIRSNSQGNENKVIRDRNEELGHLAFEFLNDLSMSSGFSSDSDSSNKSSDSNSDSSMESIPIDERNSQHRPKQKLQRVHTRQKPKKHQTFIQAVHDQGEESRVPHSFMTQSNNIGMNKLQK